MLQRFTQRARRVLSLAQVEAQSLKSPQIRPEHILLGLIGEDGGDANKALVDLGARLEDARRIVGALTPIHERIASQPDKMLLNDATKDVLAQAIDNARRQGSDSIGTAHLLMAVLSLEDSRLAGTLRTMGLDPDTVREKIMTALAHTEPDAKQEDSFSLDELLATLEICRQQFLDNSESVYRRRLQRIEMIVKAHFQRK